MHSVLVIDGLLETEQVLKAVLEPRGLRVNRVRCHDPLRAVTECGPPSVVVMHSDDGQRDTEDRSGWSDVPHVFISSEQVRVTAETGRRDCVLQQPFHYPELIETIERILTAQPDADGKPAD